MGYKVRRFFIQSSEIFHACTVNVAYHRLLNLNVLKPRTQPYTRELSIQQLASTRARLPSSLQQSPAALVIGETDTDECRHRELLKTHDSTCFHSFVLQILHRFWLILSFYRVHSGVCRFSAALLESSDESRRVEDETVESKVSLVRNPAGLCGIFVRQCVEGSTEPDHIQDLNVVFSPFNSLDHSPLFPISAISQCCNHIVSLSSAHVHTCRALIVTCTGEM